MKDFTFIILLLLVAFWSYVIGVIKRYLSYKESKIYVNYTDFAKLVEAFKKEMQITMQALLIFLPLALLIDLIILFT